ncbi:MAG: DNA-processing protein DprA [Microbacteriaceae bacterium]|nr:DNA-processing protein DprA [Microbacteriaceae bacterium]
MTMFGLKEAVVAPLIRSLGRDHLTVGEIVDRFARATWTGIAEPGDRVAGLLVALLGAPAALTAVIDRWGTDRIVGTILERSGPRGDDSGTPVALLDTNGMLEANGLTVADLVAAQERWQPRAGSQVALVALRQASRYGVRLIVPGDPDWPAGVDDLGAHAPLALWLRGRPETLATAGSSIALVGARAATGYGEHVAMEASAGLVDRGYTIVSGAAYGIDGMAHRAALASSGETIAFLAGGVDRFYPSGHDGLLTRIVEAGAVVSELPCGSPPTKWRFLQRNRLIAAASLATVVLEAGWRSGSLNTAGHAAALGRPLGAVPGPVTSAASAGCHRLIRDFDAVCVTNADEMAELAPLPAVLSSGAGGGGRGGADLGGSGGSRGNGSGGPGVGGQPAAGSGVAVPDRAESAERTRVVDALSARSPRTVGDIAARAGLSAAQVQSVLGLLELEGRAARRERGWVRGTA